jgi:WhiB family transcriptional regulator, redox-sensing transcriptional regulator
VTGWRVSANCTELEDELLNVFFSDQEMEELTALMICATCPVVNECLQYALSTSQTVGVWGMHTPQDRRNLKRQMSRRPDQAQRYWDASFDKITLRIRSTMDAQGAKTPVMAPV